jgi:hypothetical protein
VTTQYTPILKLALPVTGELSGTWGTVVNDNITSMVEQAVAGLSTINTWTANAHTLTTADGTSSEARCAMLVLATGAGGTALTAAGEVICPAASKLYVVKNGSAYAVTVKTSAGTGVAIPAGDTAFVFCDGTNVNACVTTIVNGHISGNLTVDGNTTLGDATSDTITATARFNTDLLPSTDNARDLGSTANSWRTLYCDTSVLTPLVTATNLQVTNIKANDGTAVAVLTDSTGATDFSKAFTLSAIAQNISLGASQTTGTFVLGGTAATGAITLDGSTKTHTLNVGSGATENALTKTINIGTGGVSGSTTTITIGSSNGTTTTFNGTVNVTTLDLTNLEVTNIKAKDGSASITLADSTGVASFTANPILSGGTANGVVYLNASKVATTGTALTYNGTSLVSTVTSGAATTYPAYFDNSGGGVGTGSRIGFRNTGVSYGEIGYLYDGTFATIIDSAGSSNTRLSIGGAEKVRLTSTGTLNIVGAGTAGSTQAISFNGSTPVDTLVTTSGGNVGIGTNAPCLTGLAILSGGQGKGVLVARNATGSPTSGQSLGSYAFKGVMDGLNSNAAAEAMIEAVAAENQTGLTAATNLLFYTKASGTGPGSSPTLRMTLDSSGNLGLGVVPSAWTVYKALQVNGAVFANSGVSTAFIGSNWFYDGADKYIASNYATIYRQNAGVHSWLIAPSGTAGNAISFTQAMTLDASGRLGVGVTNPGVGLVVSYGTDGIIGNYYSSGGANSRISFSNTSLLNDNVSIGSASDAMVMYTGNTERARITSGGYFKASDSGAYQSSSGTYHEFNQTADINAVHVRATNTTYSGVVLNPRAVRNTTNNSFYYLACYNETAAANKLLIADSGDVTNVNGTYGTISDAKMKTDIVDAGSQWADIKALRFRKFKMRADPSGLVQLGVVAQEVEQVSPGLVEEHKDTDVEGNDLGTTTKSVKTSVLLMKAAVALQEAMARIETLEAEVAALKGA